jgi:hypothetical protein
MFVIKISQQHPTWPFLRQTPNSSGVWGNYRFVFDGDLNEADAWVVIGDLPHHKGVTKCPPHRTLLINEEPPSMRGFPEKYISQFAVVATCGGYNFAHPGVKEIFPLQPWYIGINQRALHAPAETSAVRFNYDDLKTLQSSKKDKLLSVVFSDKTFTEGHKKRHEFIRSIKEHFGDRLEIFGRGFNYVADKWDAIADYEYHVAIENSMFPHYWTEKLADAFLGWSYPIYCGCPNIYEYFDPGSLTTIDISSPGKAVETIENIIRRKTWENSLEDIAEARRRVLDEYNMFPMIIRLLELTGQSEEKETVAVKSLPLCIGRSRILLRKILAKLRFGLGISNRISFLKKI